MTREEVKDIMSRLCAPGSMDVFQNDVETATDAAMGAQIALAGMKLDPDRKRELIFKAGLSVSRDRARRDGKFRGRK